jgi:DNA polymerase III subunit gamma/tau
MSYQVIARKWRPQTFAEVTGQEMITQTLRNAIEYDRLHHAYLFSGARGVGKTTTARILAKCLNCHKADKSTITPCLLTDPDPCVSCVEISESRSMDVLEIDAASHTGIDDVRETIIENINFNPARDRFKVFIIDEVHQLSKPAFNALLKTLEEPPDNVVFVMATTELHKVPETILSRCQEFEFRTISLQKIFDRLKLIAEAEKIDISDDALRELARSGQGSMRDAQSNFDQVISFSSEKISSADVTNALGFAGVEILKRTINAIANREAKQMLEVVDDIIGRGHDLRNFCRDLLGLFRDLLVFKIAADDKHLFEGAVFSEAELGTLAASFTETDLLRFFNSLCETEASLREASHPRYVLEIGLVKLIEMRSVATIESILERLGSLGADLPPADVTEGRSEAAAARASSPIPEKKTLIPEPPAFEAITLQEPPEEPPNEFDEEPPEQFVMPAAGQRAVYEAPATLRLPTLTAGELEHFDDTRLDDAYEEKLALTGDNLLLIKDVDTLVAPFLGGYAQPARPTAAHTSHNGSAAAASPAIDVAALKGEMAPEIEDMEIPELGAEPTQEELREYARAHTGVRVAMRVFRAKIVDVKRST